MLLDDSRFPLVFLREHEDENSSVEEVHDRNGQLESLLDRQMHFVLIADHAEHDHDDETPEERKEKALFFKRIKDRMKKYCLGLVVIEGYAPMNSAARVAAAAVSKAIGFSVQFAPDEAQATAKGLALLEKHSG
ncbi:hypothetical protein JET14_17240 [Martelella lutilitoris]|uniref:Uncharacterized protein n=1 Tax=Martelella lutilitoris TaxID=2583532 RepID=A0A7T7HJ12_9HYPH|nr:hypothetical protein [Martelella lutilitoris]QQM30013.1 hypothetical protein JET14_17240 [Martelella lutilitoris]